MKLYVWISIVVGGLAASYFAFSRRANPVAAASNSPRQAQENRTAAPSARASRAVRALPTAPPDQFAKAFADLTPECRVRIETIIRLRPDNFSDPAVAGQFAVSPESLREFQQKVMSNPVFQNGCKVESKSGIAALLEMQMSICSKAGKQSEPGNEKAMEGVFQCLMVAKDLMEQSLDQLYEKQPISGITDEALLAKMASGNVRRFMMGTAPNPQRFEKLTARLVELKPDDPTYQALHAKAAFQVWQQAATDGGEREKSLGNFDRALESLERNPQTAGIATSLRLSQLRRSGNDSALEAQARHVIQSSPDAPEGYLFLAESRYRAGDAAGATQSLRTLLGVQPNNVQARDALRMVEALAAGQSPVPQLFPDPADEINFDFADNVGRAPASE